MFEETSEGVEAANPSAVQRPYTPPFETPFETPNNTALRYYLIIKGSTDEIDKHL